MKRTNILSQLVIPILLLACNVNSEVKKEKVKLTAVDEKREVVVAPAPTGLKTEKRKSPPIVEKDDVDIQSAPAGLKVSAYLIYDDGSTSSFDILNDKSIALWNAIAGGGDTEKPSSSTKIKMTAQLNGLRVRIFNGKKKVVDEKLMTGDHEFIIKNTGCEIVKVQVIQSDKTILDNDIEFHCGE